MDAKTQNSDAWLQTFDISFDGSVTMSATEIWPDGNMPENPTAKDVALAICRLGSVSRLLEEWNLADDLDIYVDQESVRLVTP